MRPRTVLVALVGAAYVVGCHWLMTSAPDSPWNAALVIGPMLGVLALFAARRGQRLVAAAASLGLAALVLQAWRGGGLAPSTLYLAQHVAIHAALAAMFALTLRPGQEPLVSVLARRVHGGVLTPTMAAYTRNVTVAWSAYFVAMATLSIGLFAFAPFAAWALFANLLTPLAMVLMFVGEFVLRYRLHPEFERTTLADAMNAYARRDAAPADPAP
jgi:uncharacterized membrane protein